MPFDPDFDYDDDTENDGPAVAWVVCVLISAGLAIFTVGFVCGMVFS